jgi:uncharacterized protein (TIGR03435 family)
MMGPGKEKAQNAPFQNFVFLLRGVQELQGKQVVDRTVLQGKYSFTLEWTPERLSTNISETTGSASTDEGSGTSFFTSIQEKLGLRLESAKGPVDMIAVEHIEQPWRIEQFLSVR